jgi:hypothetical protein
MRAVDVALVIREEATHIASDLPGLAWYGFGSFFRGEHAYTDIDVLVVCPTFAEAACVRTLAGHLCSSLPIHLLVMTKAEQEETNFVQSENCTMLYCHSIS